MHNDEMNSKNDVEQAVEPTKVHNSLLVTLVVGLAMLVIGGLAGYFGRPLINPEPTPAPAVAAANPGNPNPASGDPSAASLMEGVVNQTRHFKGDPDAPITIVEFGDFQ